MSAKLLDLLERVCDESRANTATPFGVNYMGRRWDAATDGSLVLMIDSDAYDRRDPISGTVESIINKIPSPSYETHSMQDLRAWAGDDDGICAVCGGAGHINRADCETCYGTGVVECNMGHEHECLNCYGNGFTTDKCTACNRRICRKILGGLIDGRYINRCLVASVIHDLPGRIVQVASRDDAVAIHGVGWIALFATLAVTAPDNTPEFVSIYLHEE